MTSNYERFKAFYKTASLWSGKLVDLEQFYLSNFKFDHLEQTDSLNLPVIPQGTLLGKRAEYFFRFCIEQSSNYDLLLSNIQIFKGKVTIGELDYMVTDRKTGTIIHIELVYKFYIYKPQIIGNEKSGIPLELFKYQGPNGRDHLVRKLKHLIEHQLPLLYAPETIDLLKNHHIDISKVRQQVCFLAHVFIPRFMWSHNFELINKNSIVGYYCSLSAFAKAETSNIYFLPEKYAWKMKPQKLPISYHFTEIVDLAEASLQRGFSPLIWMQLEDLTFERFFIVK